MKGVAYLALLASTFTKGGLGQILPSDQYTIVSSSTTSNCTVVNECTLEQGVCDTNAECEGNLFCGSDNCRSSDNGDAFNCCVPRCGFRGPSFVGTLNTHCCSWEQPCDENQGHCDHNEQCKGDLVCGHDNCPWGHDNCCEPPPPGMEPTDPPVPDGVFACSPDLPCYEGQGDCGEAGDCFGDLVCGSNNCELLRQSTNLFLQQVPPDTDCCTASCGYLSQYRGTEIDPAANCCAGKPGKCQLGEGECNNDDECANGLVCAAGTCPWGGDGACCTASCPHWLLVGGGGDDGSIPGSEEPTPIGSQSTCCTPFAPCDVGEGYCEDDDACNGDLQCRKGHCPWNHSMDLACCHNSFRPTVSPTLSPTTSPTLYPTLSPSESPTNSPSTTPTVSPTSAPTTSPTTSPTLSPTQEPTVSPTMSPTTSPTAAPSTSPTAAPSTSPTTSPTASPSTSPTTSPTAAPTNAPSVSPTTSPTASPNTPQPTASPTFFCTPLLKKEGGECGGCRKDMHAGQFVYCDGYYAGSTVTHCNWVGGPGECSFPRQTSVSRDACEEMCRVDSRCKYFTSYFGSVCNLHMTTECKVLSSSGTLYEMRDECPPTQSPTSTPTSSPTTSPTTSPSTSPTMSPTTSPTSSPTTPPTVSPTTSPSSSPTAAPSTSPTTSPSVSPTSSPTVSPTAAPSTSPTAAPSTSPTTSPTASPSTSPTTSPTASPTNAPSVSPTTSPTASPNTPQPTSSPTFFCTPLLKKEGGECGGCRKDMHAGQFVYCDGYYASSTVTHCNWVGGSGECSFPRQTSVSRDACEEMCRADSRCKYFTSYFGTVCNLHMTTECNVLSSSGTLYEMRDECPPTQSPTSTPTSSPTTSPTASPSTSPTMSPTTSPTSSPTTPPTVSPTTSPSSSPTAAPSTSPTTSPSVSPTSSPTVSPTAAPSTSPTAAPSTSPTTSPTASPSTSPTTSPTAAPTNAPSVSPTTSPTASPNTPQPTSSPTFFCTPLLKREGGECGGCRKDMHAGKFVYCDGYYAGSTVTHCDWVGGPGECSFPRQTSVSRDACEEMCRADSRCKYFTSYFGSVCNLHMTTQCNEVSSSGTLYEMRDECPPTQSPTSTPTSSPTTSPTASPSTSPTMSPTTSPTSSPTTPPTVSPTTSPSSSPTAAPSTSPTTSPSVSPTTSPTVRPTTSPSTSPTAAPSTSPTTSPTASPSTSPTTSPTASPTNAPSVSPTTSPTASPNTPQPTASPTFFCAPLLKKEGGECGGCRKDMHAGQFVYCDGYYTGSTVTHCNWVGGSGECSFPRQTSVSRDACEEMCRADSRCKYFTSYFGTVCNLHMTTECNVLSSSGTLYEMRDECPPTQSPTSTPTSSPTTSPTASPSTSPTMSPTTSPTSSPTTPPTVSPTTSPSSSPTAAPSTSPTTSPSVSPTSSPTVSPTAAPSTSPTAAPSTSPTTSPTASPSTSPTTSPTAAPTNAPSVSPTTSPTASPNTPQPTSSPTFFCTPLLKREGGECGGCRKDMHAGQFVYCDGYYAGSTVTHCDWVGGPGECSFPRQTSVSRDACEEMCRADSRCKYFTSYFGSVCNLHMTTQCNEVSSSGTLYEMRDECPPTQSPTSTPTQTPTGSPSASPTPLPSIQPSTSPTSSAPTFSPSPLPTSSPNTPVPTSSPTVYCKPLSLSNAGECTGCRKDLFAGRFTYCNGYYDGSTVSHCDWVGGAGECSFPADKSVSLGECEELCRADERCHYFTHYGSTICNLHFMDRCNIGASSGKLFELKRECPATNSPTPFPTTSPTEWRSSAPTAAPTRGCPIQALGNNQECRGCKKDMFSGRFIYCDGYYTDATKTDCDWVGGPGDCTFPADKSVSRQECEEMCRADQRCRYFTHYGSSICNLHFMETCTLQSAGTTSATFHVPPPDSC